MTDREPICRVLLVANRTYPCPALLDVVAERVAGGHVHIVAPALNSRLRHYVSDTDAAVAAARASRAGERSPRTVRGARDRRGR